MPDETDNHGYKIPREGETNWDEPLNETLRKLETDVEVRDGNGNRSNYEPTEGTKFLATDTGDVYVGDGNEWQHLDTTGESPAVDTLSATDVRASDVSAFEVNADLARIIDEEGPRSLGLEIVMEGRNQVARLLDIENEGDGNGVVSSVDGEGSAVWAVANSASSYGVRAEASGEYSAAIRARAVTPELERNRAIDATGDVRIGGSSGTSLNIDADEGALVFASDSSLDESPMLYMYEGGEDNAERPVAVHSPEFPDWGLYYDDPNDRFLFRKRTDPVQAVDLQDRRVGIRTDRPTAALHVDGDVRVEGTLQADTKNFVHSVDTPGGEREVTYTSVESDTPHTETSGVAELEDGRAEVELPDHFGWVTDAEEPLVVQVTPHARERVHPQVTERSTRRIVVEDFSDAENDYEVSYTVTGTREGYADPDVVADPAAE